jgi:hypothetical protein
MKNKIVFTVSVLALVFPLAACQPQSGNHGKVVKTYDTQLSPDAVKKSRQEGYKAVKAVLDVYVSNLPGKLEGLVSNDYFPSKVKFINHVEQSALDKTIMNIEVIVDTAIFAQDKFSVNYNWNRAYLPKGSTSKVRDSGNTDFVFVKESDGWRLLHVSGSDIF